MSMPNDMRGNHMRGNHMRDDHMRDDERSHLRPDAHHDAGTGSWMVPLVLLVALALGGLIYAFAGGDSDMASDQRAPSASTTGSGGSGAGTGMTGEQTGAATTQTPRGAATGGGGAASR